eukprot:gnl/TRDRNA2_/TRDRNA2_145271_c0_seq2.p1 gnl/TRDRNA2_/TRDRNA2_145271_c0~~gnl/TRDRNA2_/TRDRNA2_145271_c0_seq2.p1  ORF type:complete len:569 (+),score=102.39 gnl/TRDRNA2_/TRDRNA2_145271_c0_seq2:244-1707(+)
MEPAGKYTWIVENQYFDGFIYGAIILNSIKMGVSLDYASGSWVDVWFWFEQIFTLILVGEMAVKLFVYGKAYFNDKWNWMDFVLGIIAMVDSWILLPLADSGSPLKAVMICRIFKVMRLARLVKVMRMRPELWVTVQGIAAAFKTMIWVILLLLLMVYFFAIFCMDMIGAEDYTYEDGSEGWAQKNVFFGSVSASMLTLFNMALLAEWAEIVRPVWQFQPYYVPAFMFFVLFTTMGILNVVIGVIVERTAAAANADNEAKLQAELQLRMQHVKNLLAVMLELDDNSDGMITVKEITSPENKQALENIMNDLDLPAGWTAKDLHTMLDEAGNGVLSAAEFLEGMFRLVFANDFHRSCLNRIAANQIKHQLYVLDRKVDRNFEDLNGKFDRILSALEGKSSESRTESSTTASAESPKPSEGSSPSAGGSSSNPTSGSTASAAAEPPSPRPARPRSTGALVTPFSSEMSIAIHDCTMPRPTSASAKYHKK